MQRDEAAGTEFQSRLGEDAEHRVRWDADAGDRTAAVQESVVPKAQAEPTMQAVPRELVLRVQVAALPEQRAELQVLRLLALPFLLALRPPEAIRLPLQETSRRAEQKHDDATGPVPRAR